jgi:hypothetical protein
VTRVGFTGGEPFLEPEFLRRVARAAVRHGLLFGRLMTNGVWFADRAMLETRLRSLHRAGFDGTLCVSVDAFHRQDVRKVAAFVRAAVRIWNRPDAVEIAVVRGAREAETRRKLARLARRLRAGARPPGRAGAAWRLDGADLLVRGDTCRIRIVPVPLAPVGPAARWRNPWDGTWFRDDYCRGPGHVLVVEPDGTVKPCCGYANELPDLALGSAGRDTPGALTRRARRRRLLQAVFESGLHPLRRRLEAAGWRFPGKTGSHCFFCRYLLTEVPRPLLRRCLRGVVPG